MSELVLQVRPGWQTSFGQQRWPTSPHAKASFDTFKVWSPDHAKAKTVAEDFAKKFRKDAPTKGFALRPPRNRRWGARRSPAGHTGRPTRRERESSSR